MANVDFLNNPKDMKVAVLGSLGLSTAYIAAVTGFTSGQVIYRLTKGSVRRNDYRNGHSQIAKYVVGVATEQAEHQFVRRGRKLRVKNQTV